MKSIYLILPFWFCTTILDAQLTWQAIPSIYGDADIESILKAPNGKWYIKGHNILYSSEDAGNTWVMETTFGLNTNIRNLKFLQDGTPVFGTHNPTRLLIKRDGEWVNLPASNDFEVYLDTLYAIRSNHVQKSYDKGQTWMTHLRMQGSTIYRYRQHHGRHYVEYAEGVNRKFGEVTLDGTIIRWEWSQLSGYQMFVIDDCDNAHFLYDDYHTVLYSDGTDESHDFNYIDGKYTYYKDRIYRLVNSYLYKNVPCSHIWEYVGAFNNARDFYAIGTDTLMFAFEKQIAFYTLPQVEISKVPIQNTNYISWSQEEIPGGTKYLQVNAGTYRIRPDGTQELMAESFSHLKFAENGWIYQETPKIPGKLVVSKDAGVTWDTLSKPSAIPPYYSLYPITPEIIIYNAFDTTFITFADGSVYILPTDSSTLQGIYHFQYQVLGDLLLMKGYNYIAGFNLTTRQYHPLLFLSPELPSWSRIDDDGTFFMLDEDEKILTSVPYPYNESRSVTLPQGYFRNATNAEKGYLVAHNSALYHFTKDLLMTTIDLGPIASTQLGSIVYAKSGNWIANTFSRWHGAFVSSGVLPNTDRATITGQVFSSDLNCTIDAPISSANWKFHFTNAENDILAIGHSGSQFSINLPAGDYDVEVLPPPFTIFNPCDWPEHITVPDNDAIIDWNIVTGISLCEAASISVSSAMFRRCFKTMAYVIVRNWGSVTIENPVITLTLSPHHEIIALPVGYSQAENVYTLFPPGIEPGNYISIPITLFTKCSAELGLELCINAAISVSENCADWDYNDALCLTTVGSWDPNDKLVTDERGADIKEFKQEDYITYKIRFQNTGTDTAFNVRVVDMLDPKLDLLTFEMISSSHICTYSFEDGRRLVIDYPNILLPDSTKNLLASNGFFEFRIKANENITPADTIFNSADIFFDFNEAVVTNRVPVHIEMETGISITPEQNTFFISPNPATNQIRLTFEKAALPVPVQIMSSEGELIENLTLDDSMTIPLHHLLPGMYYVKIYQEGKFAVQKFVKM